MAGPSERSGALLEAALVVAEAAEREPGAVLDVLVAEARRLLGADEAAVHLAGPGGSFGRGRAGRVPAAAWRPAPTRAPPPPAALVAEAAERGAPVFAADLRADGRVGAGEYALYSRVTSVLVVPLVAGADVLGVLVVGWARLCTPDAQEFAAAAALGRHAAVALRTSRLLAESRRAHGEAEAARAELAALLDTAEDPVLGYDRAGDLRYANRAARRRLGSLVRRPATPDELWARLQPATPDGAPLAFLPAERALAHGRPVAQELVVRDRRGRAVHVHAHAAPVRGPGGVPAGAVAVLRDVTALREAVASRTRLEGAVKTARLAVDRLGTSLASLAADAELLGTRLGGEPAHQARQIARAGWRAATTVDRLRAIVRFAQAERAGEAFLDPDPAPAARVSAAAGAQRGSA
ncbi:MAG TPA: GAF domain-containing protein [Chloroflexota bacterium]|nr:GAF domain-containing protein [Chloroflexota bacterium]